MHFDFLCQINIIFMESDKAKSLNIFQSSFLAKLILVFTFFLLFLTSLFLLSAWHHEEEISFLDSSHGSAFLIKNKEGKNILFGAGKDSRINEFLSSNISFFDKKIDALFLISAKKNALGGFKDLAERFTVEKIINFSRSYPSSIFRNTWEKAQEKGVSVKLAREGEKFRFGDLSVEVLYSRQENEEKEAEIILRIESNEEILFVNLLAKSQREIIRTDLDIGAEKIIFLGSLDEDFFRASGAGEKIEITASRNF